MRVRTRIGGRARGRMAAWVLALAATLPACGNLTAGGAAEGEAVVTGGEAEPQGPSPSRISRPDAEAPALDSGFEGSVTVTLRVELLVPGGSPVDLSGETREVTVDIQGSSPASLGVVEVPPGVYEGVRVTFTAVEAAVTAGFPPLGSGIVEVDFGETGQFVVEEIGTVEIEAGERLTTTIGLGAEGWIAVAAADLLTVLPASVVAEYVTVATSLE